VADAVNAEGGKIDRAMVVLDKPIKTLGVHAVKVRLHPEVSITVNINIARSQDEAERQARGEDVIAGQFEAERALDAQAAADLLEGGAGQQVFEGQRAEIESRNAKAREAASKSGENLDGHNYVMIRQAGESGQLYGSVSGRDVADAVNAEGGKIDRAMVVLDKPIKTLGVHAVKVKLHAEVTITVNINIARSVDEAERQARGEDVINTQFEADRSLDAEQAADLLEGGAGAQGFAAEEG